MQYEDKHFSVVYNASLTANQVTEPIAVQLDKDADFCWMAAGVSYSGLPFGIIFRDSTEYQLSDDYLNSCAFAANVGVGVPYTMYPPIWFPAGASITILLKNLTGLNNAFQLVFTGIKRFTA